MNKNSGAGWFDFHSLHYYAYNSSIIKTTEMCHCETVCNCENVQHVKGSTL